VTDRHHRPQRAGQFARIQEHHASEAARTMNSKNARIAAGPRAVTHALLAIAWVGVQMYRELRRIRRLLEQRPTATIGLEAKPTPKEG